MPPNISGDGVAAIVQDIKEGMAEVRNDVKELRTEFHALAIKVATMGDTHVKVENIENRVDKLDERMVQLEFRINTAEKSLALTKKDADKVENLQQQQWMNAGKMAGLGIALTGMLILAEYLSKVFFGG